MVKLLSRITFFVLVLLPGYLRAQQVPKLHVQTDRDSYHAGEIIWFRVDNNEPASKIVYTEILDTANIPVLQGKIPVENTSGAGSFFIPPGIRSGRYLLRAYTSPMKGLDPSTYFQKDINLYNIQSQTVPGAANTIRPAVVSSQSLALAIRADKPAYGTRDRISLDIEAGKAATMSVSVYRIDSLQPVPGDEKENTQVVTEAGEEYIPEFNGHLIRGRIINEKNGAPAAGMTSYLFVPGLKYLFSTAVSDDAGNVQFEIKQLYGVTEIMLQTDSGYRVELKDPFSNRYPQHVSPTPALQYPATFLDESVSAQVQLVYNGTKQNEFIIPPIDSTPFYGKGDVVYAIDDYVKFETMEEILREYVVPVGLQRRNGKLTPFIYDELRRKPFSSVPLILVDGIPLFDVDKFMAISPAILSKISIVNRRFFVGKKMFEGIIDIDTKINYADSVELDKNVTVINYEGLQLKRKFYSPVYETQEQRSSRLPDFRTVLFWSPDIQTGEDGKCSVAFYSSDLKGKFAVVVRGVTADGKSGSTTAVIEVQ